MANALKFASPSIVGDRCHAAFDVTGLDAKYVRIEVLWTAASHAAWGTGSPLFAQLNWSPSEHDIFEGCGWFEPKWYGWENPSNFGAAIVDDVWNVVEFALPAANEEATWMKVNRVSACETYTDLYAPITTVFAGFLTDRGGSSGAPGGEVWIGRIWVGTQPGLSDILNYDPSAETDPADVFTIAGVVTLEPPPTPIPATTANVIESGQLHADTNGGAGNCWYVFPIRDGVPGDFYAKAEIYYTSASAAVMGYIDMFAALQSLPSDEYQSLYRWHDGGSIYNSWGDFWDGNLVDPAAVAPDTWHTLEMWIPVVGEGYFKADGVLNPNPITFGAREIKGIAVGMIDNPGLGDVWFNRVSAGTTEGGTDILDFNPNAGPYAVDDTWLRIITDTAGEFLEVAAAPDLPPGAVDPSIDVTFAGIRFFEGFEWRYLFTDLNCVATTWAHGLIAKRKVAFVLDQPATIEGSIIDPTDFRVNGLWTDGYPRIAQSNRLVFAFRRTGGSTRWEVEGAGILMSPEDEGDSDVPVSHFTAYDPWKYLEGRPCMADDGTLAGSDGFFMPFAGNVVALTFLKNTIVNEGGCFIDAGVAWGGTSFYGGTIETTPVLNYQVQQGMSVAQVWDDLCNSGNCDIVLKAIYDPVNRPGYTHEISIYKLAGKTKPNALFAWDRLNRCVSRIDRLHDGTPGAFFDKVQYHAGSGGPPVPLAGPVVNAAAVAVYGSVWSTQFFPAQTNTDATASAVLALAKQALVMAKQGRRTLTMNPITERAPVPLQAYRLGDRVPVYSSARLRVETNGYLRVQGIPIEIDDDGRETVGGLLLTPDWRGGP